MWFDVIVGIGCLDYVNQVNNVLVFLYLFCGVLDIYVCVINDEMKIVCVCVLVEFVWVDVFDEVVMVYGCKLIFGWDYIILMLFDLCLIYIILFVVVKVGMDIGVV